MQINHAQSRFQGDEIKTFLEHQMQQLGIEIRPGEQSEFTLGFAALRRSQAVRLAEKHGINLGGAAAMTEIVPILDTAYAQGRFPPVAPQKDQIAEEVTKQVLQDIKGDPDLLRKLLAEAEGEDTPAEVGQTLAQVVEAEKVPEPTGIERYLGMVWNDLKKTARDRGIDPSQKGMTREVIIEALVAQDGSDTDPA